MASPRRMFVSLVANKFLILIGWILSVSGWIIGSLAADDQIGVSIGFIITSAWSEDGLLDGSAVVVGIVWINGFNDGWIGLMTE